MIYLTSYVPTDTKGLLRAVVLVLSTVGCCNLGEIHGFQGKDETKAFQVPIHQIRQKNQSKKPPSTATRRVHALTHDLLSPAGGLQSPTGGGDISPVRINRGNHPSPVWQMHRLPDRQIETMGSPLHARSFTPPGQRVHHIDLCPSIPACWWYISH